MPKTPKWTGTAQMGQMECFSSSFLDWILELSIEDAVIWLLTSGPSPLAASCPGRQIHWESGNQVRSSEFFGRIHALSRIDKFN